MAKTFPVMGMGKDMIKTPIAQKIIPRVDQLDCMKLKSVCMTKEKTDWRRNLQNEKYMC